MNDYLLSLLARERIRTQRREAEAFGLAADAAAGRRERPHLPRRHDRTLLRRLLSRLRPAAVSSQKC